MDLASHKQWLLIFLCALNTIKADQDTTLSYFKACLHFQQSWQNQQNQQSFQPSHPLSKPTAAQTQNHVPLCRSYQCLMLSDILDLQKLRQFQCYEDSDCAQDISGMICSNHSQLLSSLDNSDVKYCSCPPGYAYSTVECRCKPAELCWSSQDPCHKGMKCQDHKCSCRDLENLLYEIHGGFCIEPRSTHFGMDRLTSKLDQDQESNGKTAPEIIVLALLAAILFLGILAFVIYGLILYKRQEMDFCARGDYVCDHDTITPGNRQNQPHVAAWDAPGMDFLSEEQTLKYLNRSNSVIEVTKSPSMATTAELVEDEVAPSPSGSLPECERQGAVGTSSSNHHRKMTAESNYDNPSFNGSSSRNSSESKDNDDDSVTKASNML